MAVTRMNPGTVLGGRYRLDDLVDEITEARLWRATDTVLERDVAVWVVPAGDRRIPDVVTAARTAATVTDPHFSQVLDCVQDDDGVWVVNEWADGASLRTMLETGPLPPVRAAWLTREVAGAVSSLHSRGLAHGRLTPGAVHVTTAGAVLISGLFLNAALDPVLGPTTPDRRQDGDVCDLGGVLYAALTGRWAGTSPSRLAAAPRTLAGRPLRPRQVRAGVPRILDTICDRSVNRDPDDPRNLRTAWEVGAALSDFIGDPAAAAPADLSSIHAEPTTEADAEAASEELSDVVRPLSLAGPATTMAGVVEFSDDLDGPAKRPAPVTTPPPVRPANGEAWRAGNIEPPAITGPLFADEPRRTPAESDDAPGGAADGTDSAWPFTGEPVTAQRKRVTGTNRIVLIVLAALVVIAAAIFAFNLGRTTGRGKTSTTPAGIITLIAAAAVGAPGGGPAR